MSLYPQLFFRNPFSAAQTRKIRTAAFAIIGLGGTGGFMLENLVRMGAEQFIIFDHDRFELSNFNRQLLATSRTIDMPKTKAALARARSINPSVRMELNGDFDADSPASAPSIGAASVLLDASDNVETRIAAAAVAREQGVPYVFCSAEGSRGMVSIFTKYKFEKAFQLQGTKAPDSGARRRCRSVMCPAAAIAGSLAASQAINLILGKAVIRAPDVLMFDLHRSEIFWRARLG